MSNINNNSTNSSNDKNEVVSGEIDSFPVIDATASKDHLIRNTVIRVSDEVIPDDEQHLYIYNELILDNIMFACDVQDYPEEKVQILKLVNINKLVINSVHQYKSDEYQKIISKVVNNGILEFNNVMTEVVDCTRFRTAKFSNCYIFNIINNDNACDVDNNNVIVEDIRIFQDLELLDENNVPYKYSGTGYYNYKGVFNRHGFGTIKYSDGKSNTYNWNDNVKI